MIFEIGTPVVTSKIKNMYMVVVSTMEGDADDFHSVEFYFKQNAVARMQRLVELLDKIKVRYPHGKGGCAYYEDVPGFCEFFESGGDHEDCDGLCGECNRYPRDAQVEVWPHSSNSDCVDSFNEYCIVYFDENGDKFNVRVVA